MRQLVGQVVKRRMAVHFILRGLVKAVGIIGVGGMDGLAFHHPNAYTFLPARVHIAGVFNGHLRISGVQTAYMFVVKPLLAADKYFPKRPKPPYVPPKGGIRQSHVANLSNIVLFSSRLALCGC